MNENNYWNTNTITFCDWGQSSGFYSYTYIYNSIYKCAAINRWFDERFVLECC